MKTTRLLGLCWLAATLVVFACLKASFAAKPAPPPPLPPVRFQIHYWKLPNPAAANWSLSDMNNLGQVVGWYLDVNGAQRAFIYDPILDNQTAFDLETLIAGAGVPANWKIASAVGLNDRGQIVGYLTPAGSGFGSPLSDGFVLDLGAPTPQVTPLPNWGGWAKTYARRINNYGDILGVYQNPNGGSGIYFYPSDGSPPYFLDQNSTTVHLNNPLLDDNGNVTRPAQVAFANATTFFRWTPQSGGLEALGGFTSADVRGLNDSGVMAGSRTSGKTATRNPIRLSELPALTLSNTYGIWGQDINAHGDVLISPGSTGRGAVYRDDWAAYGYYGDLSKLVVGSSADMNLWNSAIGTNVQHMNDRTVAGAGEIVGNLSFRNGTTAIFQLTPVTP